MTSLKLLKAGTTTLPAGDDGLAVMTTSCQNADLVKDAKARGWKVTNNATLLVVHFGCKRWDASRTCLPQT